MFPLLWMLQHPFAEGFHFPALPAYKDKIDVLTGIPELIKRVKSQNVSLARLDSADHKKRGRGFQLSENCICCRWNSSRRRRSYNFAPEVEPRNIKRNSAIRHIFTQPVTEFACNKSGNTDGPIITGKSVQPRPEHFRRDRTKLRVRDRDQIVHDCVDNNTGIMHRSE